MHCRTASGRGAVHCGGEHRLASVYLLTASLFLPSQALLPSLPRFPRSFFHSRLCLLPFLPVGYVRVPDSLPSSLLPSFSLSLSSISPLCRAPFFSPFFPPVFFPPRGDGIPGSFPIGRLKERIVNRRMSRGFRNGDCSIRRFLSCRARARASDGWSTHDASIGN